MPIIILDYETYSPVPISHGTKKYAEHPDADIVLMGWKRYGKKYPGYLWKPGEPPPEEFFDPKSKFVAHNALFDWRIENIIGTRYGLPPFKLSQMIDSMALATTFTLPPKLDEATQVTGCLNRKNKDGKSLIKKICIPNSQGQRPVCPYDFTASDLERFGQYCLDDVYATEELLTRLPQKQLTDYEQYIWEITQTINDSGVPVDIQAIERILEYISSYVDEMTYRVQELSRGAFSKVTQVQKLRDWMALNGVKVPNLQANTVIRLLKDPKLPANVREMLILRQTLGRSSTAKFHKLLQLEHKGYVHDNLMYHGTNTGRWSGRAFQLHNLPRASVEDPEKEINKFMRFMAVEDPVNVAKALIRPMIKAPPGMLVYAGDFTSVENFIIMWLADETEAMQAILNGRNQYVDMASFLFKRSYDEIAEAYKAGDKQAAYQRLIGKIIILGCGFMMGVDRFIETAADWNVKLTYAQAKSAVKAFRTKYARVAKMWRTLHRAVIFAIQNPGREVKCHKCTFVCKQGWLRVYLPSGRPLWYANPFIGEGKYGLTPKHEGKNPYSKKWSVLEISPGRITENIVQAIARDLLANAKVNVFECQSDLIMIASVHDELICLGPDDSQRDQYLDLMLELMCEKPNWAIDLPLKADGFYSKRYRK